MTVKKKTAKKKATTKKKLTEDIKTTAKKKPVKKTIKGNLPTGSTLINLVLGGGFPFGIVNIVGDSSSGKSFLAGEFIACAFHKYGKKFQWFYDNAEGGYKVNTEKLYGFNILENGFLPADKRSNTIEDFERNISTIIEKKDPKIPFIYVLDSFDAISSEAELAHRGKKIKSRQKKSDSDTEEEEVGKGSYNLSKQKENHAIFRTLVRKLEDNNVVLIVVSQVKERIGITFGAKLYRTGGKSLDFYPNIVFWLAEVEKYLKKQRPVGICAKVRGTKTRNDKPFRTCLIDIVFDYGLDNISSNINFLYSLKTTDRNQDKKNLTCVWDGIEFTRSKLVQYIEDKNLEDELAARVIEKWNNIEESISSKNRKARWEK